MFNVPSLQSGIAFKMEPYAMGQGWMILSKEEKQTPGKLLPLPRVKAFDVLIQSQGQPPL